MEEDLGARLNHPNKKIYRKKKDKIACYQRNNERNRDIYSTSQAQGKMIRASNMAIEAYLDKKLEEYVQSPEDDLITLLDLGEGKNPVDDSDGFEE